MTIAKLINESDFLRSLLVSPKKFNNNLKAASDTQIQLLVELCINSPLFKQSTQEIKKINTCEKLIRHFKNKRVLYRKKLILLFIKYRQQLITLINIILMRITAETIIDVCNC